MRDIVRVALFILVLSGAFAAPVAAGPFEDGVAAAKRGDYATAFQLWRPLAEQGHAIAQANVGVMYYEGRGVTQDYAEAVKWYRTDLRVVRCSTSCLCPRAVWFASFRPSCNRR